MAADIPIAWPAPAWPLHVTWNAPLGRRVHSHWMSVAPSRRSFARSSSAITAGDLRWRGGSLRRPTASAPSGTPTSTTTTRSEVRPGFIDPGCTWAATACQSTDLRDLLAIAESVYPSVVTSRAMSAPTSSTRPMNVDLAVTPCCLARQPDVSFHRRVGAELLDHELGGRSRTGSY